MDIFSNINKTSKYLGHQLQTKIQIVLTCLQQQPAPRAFKVDLLLVQKEAKKPESLPVSPTEGYCDKIGWQAAIWSVGTNKTDSV